MNPGKASWSPSTSASLRESPRRWALMALLVSAMIVCYAHRASLAVAAPFVIKDLGLSLTAMGVLLSAFSWSYSFMQLPAGWIVDRFGVRSAYAWGYVIWSLAFILTGFARGILLLVCLRVLLGIGQAVAFPASARAVANWFQDRERGTVTAGYLAGVRLGAALISGVGAYFLTNFSWQVLFLTVGAVSLLWLLPWEWFLRGLEAPGSSAPSKHSVPPRSSSASGVTSVLNRNVLGIFLGFFAYDYAWFVYLNWLPGYLVIERKFTPREMGIYSSIPYLAMLAIIMLSGIVSDFMVRRGLPEVRVRRTMIMIGLSVGCLVVPAGLVESRMAAVWLLTVALCGLGIASPNTWTLTQAVCPRETVGRVSGIQNFGGNLGGILAPWLTGYIAQATQSFALALSLTGAILVGGISAYAMLIRSPREHRGSS
ncbi:MAG: MFS transporter [Acidobacteria bacterium]|nr:MFS transporter [Acidobacteriota bacterium]